MRMKNNKRSSGFDQLKPGEPTPRPPDRPRIFPKGPIPPPQVVFIDGPGTSYLPPVTAPRPKKPRHGKR